MLLKQLLGYIQCLFLSFIFLTQLSVRIEGNNFFCYTVETCGPSQWKGICHDGKMQSPVDLSTTDAEAKPKNPLVFENFMGDQNGFYVANNGHSVRVQMKRTGESRFGFSHEDIDLHYKFSQLHFHWGMPDQDGSEHTVNMERFPLEIHLVHHKKEYESLITGVRSGDPSALSVIGVLVKIGRHNKALEPIIQEIKDKALNDTKEMHRSFETIDLYSLLPEKKSMFRYLGSLTTPTCNEVVLWVVFDTPLEISKEQAETFHSIQSNYEHSQRMHNFRPVQPLNGRNVEYFKE